MKKRMNNKLLFFVFMIFQVCIFSGKVNSQDIRPEILALVNSMSREKCVYLFRPQYFEQFQQSVYTEELKILLHHENPVIRGYSFWALSRKDYDEAFDVLLRNINNRDIVNYCSAELDHSFEGYLYYRIWKGYAKQKPTEGQIRYIDSLVIHQETAIPHFEAFKKFYPGKSYYNKIKEIAMSQSYSKRRAIAALARYRCKEDIPLILSFLDDEDTKSSGILAIVEFPDSAFYDLVVSMLWEEIHNKWIGPVGALYAALVQYPTEETVKQIKKMRRWTPLYKRKTYNEALRSAIERYPNDIFNSFK